MDKGDLRSPDAEFLAALVHEIRNPLAPIFSAAQLLRSLCSDPRQLAAVETIERQVARLTRLIDDLADAADVGRGALQLRLQDVDVAEIVQQALTALRPRIDERRQNLCASLPPKPARMRCDPERLLQILQNLLDYASRNTPASGEITVTATQDGYELLIEVSDNGYGIDREALPRLFNLFTQHDPVTRRVPASLDVGLAIARNLVEMHGGSIAAASPGRGQGSRFTVRLPLEPRQPDLIEPDVGPRSASPRKILIVEDDAAVADSLAACLWDCGYTVVTAADGNSGICLAKTLLPEVIIIDIGLPDVDGFDVARRLREVPETASALLVAASGYGLRAFRQLSDHWIFDHYLLKPTSADTLTALIEHALRMREHH